MRYSLALALAVAASAVRLDPQERPALAPFPKEVANSPIPMAEEHKNTHTSISPPISPRSLLENASTKMRRVAVNHGRLSARHADIEVVDNRDVKEAVSQDRTNVAMQHPHQLKPSVPVAPKQAVENQPSPQDTTQQSRVEKITSIVNTARQYLKFSSLQGQPQAVEPSGIDRNKIKDEIKKVTTNGKRHGVVKGDN